MIEGPYKLPKGWRWVRLGDVFKLKNGKFIRTTDLQAEGNIPVYGSNGLLGFTANPLLTEGRTIVIGRVGACGAINVVDAPCWISDNAMFVANWFIECDIEYVALALRNIDFSFFIKKGAQPSISQELIYNIFIPFPPLDEQKRIVARVEELMSRIKEAKKLKEETKKQTELLWQSVLAETFPQPGTQLPKGWRWVRLGEVAKIFSGSSAPQGKQYFEGGTYPFVRVQDLGRYRITDDLRETVDKVNEHAIKKLRLVKAKKGSIVFPKSGAAILTNSRAILGIDAYVVSHLAIVEPNYTKVDNRWIFYYLCSVDMAKFIDNPSYPSLRLSKIKEIHIPLPPLDEQKRIANYLQEVHEKIQELKEVQAKTEEEIKLLEQSILEKAFRGEM